MRGRTFRAHRLDRQIGVWGHLAEAATLASACALVTLAAQEVASVDALDGGSGIGVRDVAIGAFIGTGVVAFACGIVALRLGERHGQATTGEQGRVALAYSFLAIVFATVVIRIF